MNKKRNYVIYIGILMIMLFSGACGKRPVQEGTITITMPPPSITEPLGTATPEPTPTVPEVKPEVTPVVSPEPTPSPVLTPTPEIVATPQPTPTAELTPELQPTKEPEPTKELTLAPTPEPTPSKKPSPEPTKKVSPTPTKEAELIPTPEPTPAIDPLPLVHVGWQNVLDITMDHYIIFPECFDGSEIEQKDFRLAFLYTSSTDENVKFSIAYTIGQTYEEAVEEVYAWGGVVEGHSPEGKSFSYIIEKDGMVFYGWAMEESYRKELLGEGYQDKETPGTMRVELSYPILLREQYETEEFRYYIKRIE